MIGEEGAALRREEQHHELGAAAHGRVGLEPHDARLGQRGGHHVEQSPWHRQPDAGLVRQLPLPLPPEGLLDGLDRQRHREEHRDLGFVQQQRHRASSGPVAGPLREAGRGGGASVGVTVGLPPAASVAERLSQLAQPPAGIERQGRPGLRHLRHSQDEERAGPLAVPVLEVMEGDRDLDQSLERRPRGLRRAEPDGLEQLVHLEEEPVIRERRRPLEERRHPLAARGLPTPGRPRPLARRARRASARGPGIAPVSRTRPGAADSNQPSARRRPASAVSTSDPPAPRDPREGEHRRPRLAWLERLQDQLGESVAEGKR